ncbi:MAG: hypothetical protein GKR89_37180 [Candidatus Latescibacteria bacterium]|nr:hypothetical protein [Candidatus Latescibacterota bacterium]
MWVTRDKGDRYQGIWLTLGNFPEAVLKSLGPNLFQPCWAVFSPGRFGADMPW